jgi:hypothetical protein
LALSLRCTAAQLRLVKDVAGESCHRPGKKGFKATQPSLSMPPLTLDMRFGKKTILVSSLRKPTSNPQLGRKVCRQNRTTSLFGSFFRTKGLSVFTILDTPCSNFPNSFEVTLEESFLKSAPPRKSRVVVDVGTVNCSSVLERLRQRHVYGALARSWQPEARFSSASFVPRVAMRACPRLSRI